MNLKIIFILTFSLFLISCGGEDSYSLVKATDLTQGAQKIRIVNNLQEKCEFLGEVVGSQGNWFTGGLTSNQVLEQGARNKIKNKAFRLGADTVVLMTNRQGQGKGFETTSITYTGNAYKCKKG